jgi:hypothetical protein
MSVKVRGKWISLSEVEASILKRMANGWTAQANGRIRIGGIEVDRVAFKYLIIQRFIAFKADEIGTRRNVYVITKRGREAARQLQEGTYSCIL